MATAHAKARLSPKVEERDASAAEDILRYALFKDVVKRQRRKKRTANHGGGAARGDEEGSGEDDEASEEEEEEQGPPERMMAVPTTKKAIDQATPGISQDPIWGAVDDVQMDLDPTESAVAAAAAAGGASGDPTAIIPDRYATFFLEGVTVLTSDHPPLD